MTRFQFELATSVDDAALRSLMAQTPMPGDVTLAFEREPSFFLGNRVLGDRCQTIVCRDHVCGDIVGIATRSSRMMFVGGTPTRVGYLGSLRLDKRVRSAGLLARGFRFLRDLHESDPERPELYLTTIAAENKTAKAVLTRGRAGLPTYHPAGTLNTIAISCRSLRPKRFSGNRLDSRRTVSTLADLPSIQPWLDFVLENGRRRDLFPVYQRHDFEPPIGTFGGLDFASIVILWHRGKIVATGGIWNQSSFRQTVIRDYAPAIRITRPLVNTWARISGSVALPPIGSPLSAAYVSILVLRNDDPSLLKRLLHELALRSDCQTLLLGRCDGDPLLASCLRLSPLRYKTEIFSVKWDQSPKPDHCPWQPPFYLELGCL